MRPTASRRALSVRWLIACSLPLAVLATHPAHADDLTHAQTAALADGTSTLIALGAGAVEANPLMPASPAGIVGMTIAKAAMAHYAADLPPEQRETALRGMGAAWWGAAASNVLTAMGAAHPLCLLAGLGVALASWHRNAPAPAPQAAAVVASVEALP